MDSPRGLKIMAAKHTLRIDFDDATGEVSVVHRTTVSVAGQPIAFAQPVDLADADAAKATLKALVDGNREAMEKAAGAAAIQHAAAVAGTSKHKQIKLGGTMGPVGGTKAEKS